MRTRGLLLVVLTLAVLPSCGDAPEATASACAATPTAAVTPDDAAVRTAPLSEGERARALALLRSDPFVTQLGQLQAEVLGLQTSGSSSGAAVAVRLPGPVTTQLRDVPIMSSADPYGQVRRGSAAANGLTSLQAYVRLDGGPPGLVGLRADDSRQLVLDPPYGFRERAPEDVECGTQAVELCESRAQLDVTPGATVTRRLEATETGEVFVSLSLSGGGTSSCSLQVGDGALTLASVTRD